jgi:charged multivesicular body protein 6
MLGGRISNHDEDEVEDELEALEREVNGVQLPDVPLPNVPTTELSSKERAKARQREQEEQRTAMLA